MNSKRKALVEAIRDAAESFAREAYDLADLLERAEQEEWGMGANPSPGHREPSERPERTPPEADTLTMTPDQYRAAVGKLGLTHEETADALGVARSTHYKYLREGPIPPTVAKLLSIYLRYRMILAGM